MTPISDLTMALFDMKVAVRKVYRVVVASGAEAPATAHHVALEALERAYRAIFADLEARHAGSPGEQMN